MPVVPMPSFFMPSFAILSLDTGVLLRGGASALRKRTRRGKGGKNGNASGN